MKSIFTKMLLVLLALTMLFGLVACGDDKNKEEESTQADNSDKNDTESIYQKDSIPDDIDYKGTEVVVLYPDDRTSEFNPEEVSDAVEQEVVMRNLTVEDRLKVDLTFTPTTGGYNSAGSSPYKQTVMADITAGLGSYDICADYGMTIGSCAIDGMCVNLKDYSIIDFDAPWWASDLNTSATINGKLYFGTGDISTSYLSNMFCMFVNEDLMDALTLDNPYDMVEMDNWKWEFFIQYCKEIYADLDDIQGKSAGDRYGITMTHVVGESVFYSGGCQFLETNEDGELILSDSLSNSRASNFYDLTQAFFSDSNDAYVSNDNWRDVFKTGNSVFTISHLSFAATLVSENIEMNYGVLPIPKYDDNQSYRSACWVGRSLYFIPICSKIPDIAATTFECLASEGYRQVTPVLYEDTYKLRYSTDENSRMMIDLIRDSITFDLAQVYTYSFDNQLPTRLTRALAMGTIAGYDSDVTMSNLSSAMASYKTMMQTVTQKIANSYR